MRKAFTLIELLVVIIIIALLLSIFIPILSKVKDSAKDMVCTTGLKQLAISVAMYVNTHRDYPDAYGIQAVVPDISLSDKLKPYIDAPSPLPGKKISPWVCPFDTIMHPTSGGSYMYTPFYYRIWYRPSMTTIYDNVPLLPMIRDFYPRRNDLIHIVRSDTSTDKVKQTTYAPGASWLSANRR